MTLWSDADDVLKMSKPSRHTFFQLNFFVVGKEPTTQAKLHRCLEEIKTRRSSAQAIEMEVEDLHDRRALLEDEKRKLTERTIPWRQAVRKIAAIDKSLADLAERKTALSEEVQFFLDAFRKYEKLEPLKNWDDVDVQMEYWNAKLMHELSVKAILRQPFDAELLKTIMAMPDRSPVKRQVVEMIDHQQKLLENPTYTNGKEVSGDG